MSTGETMDHAADACIAARCSGAREALAIAMLAYGLAQGGEAFGADQSADVARNIQPMVGGKPLPMQFAPVFKPSELPAPSDFQRRTAVAAALQPSALEEPSLPSQDLPATSSWHHFADYRTQGRVQLLTLWQSPRSTVSLQTGRHGGPSLQWSSRIDNRGGATRGLLDRIVASSLGATGLGAKLARGAAASPATKAMGSGPAKSP